MKLIHINESQGNRLFEAYREGFSLKTLSELGSKNWGVQYDYCVKWLGEPNFHGSSRCVFTLNDNMVLKLAFGNRRNAGIAQNKQEYEMYEIWKSPLFVRIFSADENFTYLICESVLPAEDIDFEKILGIPIGNVWNQTSEKYKEPYNNGDTTVGFNKYFDGSKSPFQEYDGVTLFDIFCYLESNYVTDEYYYDKNIENIIDNSEWLSELRNLVDNTKISDFCDVENYGMVNRDGTPTLVILDAGMNLDLWQKYYSE